MKFAVDADPVGRDGSGNETYLRGLLGAMADQIAGDQLILYGSRPAALESIGATAVVGCRPGLLGDLSLGLTMRRSTPDAALAHYNLPLGLGRPAATIVHDVAFLRVGSTFPVALRLRLRASVQRSVRQSAAIVTVSEFSRAELLDCYPGLDRSRVVVAPNAPKPIFGSGVELEHVRSRYQLPAEFVLGVGNIQPRKNLHRLVSAASRLGLPVVLVGQVLHAPSDAVPAGATWLGRVDDAELAALYRLCTVFAYVSLYEGFGLPVIEALASGAVVVTSSTTALAEVAGDAAVLVDPLSVDSIAEGLSTAAGDSKLRDELVVRGARRAAQYSWADSAATVLGVLHRIAR